MANFKYIMFQDKHGRRFPVIFPGEMVHSDVADAIQHAVRRGEIHAGLKDYSCPKPVNAGFVSGLLVNSTYGESETLSKVSDEGDAATINVYEYIRGL